MTTVVTLAWIMIAPLIAGALTPSQIVIWLTLIPYLFLPEAFAIPLPGLPDIDKTAAVTIGLLLSFMIHRSKFAEVPRPAPRSTAVKIFIITCVVLMVAGSVMTILTNREPIIYGPTVLPGLQLWDLVSRLAALFFFMVPFFFAMRYLATPKAQRDLLAAFVVMGLVYSLLMLIEIRLSPQLHNWVYGYHQHSFAQHVRDGFRPKVFLQHGIWVGFFMFMVVMAACGLWKSTKKPGWLLAALWLLLVLGISKNLAATAICLMCMSMLFFTGRWLQTTFAASIAVVILLYPAARQAHLIPLDDILSLASIVSADRAQSLQFRIDNEDELLARAYQKPLFGWGSYSREQIYNEAGRRTSISESYWTLTIGPFGWVGYIALFGILAIPVIFLRLRKRTYDPPPETVTLALIITGNLIYLTINATLTPIGWLVFGALAGYLRYSDTDDLETEDVLPSVHTTPSSRKIAYTRFPPKQARYKI